MTEMLAAGLDELAPGQPTLVELNGARVGVFPGRGASVPAYRVRVETDQIWVEVP